MIISSQIYLDLIRLYMVVYGLYLYIIIGYTRKYLCVAFLPLEKQVEECVISYKVNIYSMVIYRINFHL